jgi:hypothetical protein
MTESGRKLETIAKYQLMLTAGGVSPLAKGFQPYQDARLAVRLRNALMHYRPETLWSEEIDDLQKQLHGKFAENTLRRGAGNPWWPNHCLGQGCAQWVIHSVRALADDVFARLNVTPNYQRLGEPLLGEEP